MNLRLLTILAAAGALSAAAAGVTPGQAVKVDLPAGSHHPVLSPDGSRMLFSTEDHLGLNSLDLATGVVTEIDPGMAAGFQPVFSRDGSSVFYRTATKQDRLLVRDVRRYTFGQDAPRQLQGMSRDEVNLSALAGDSYAMADFKCIRVRTAGAEMAIDPLADSHSYLWASLSPDGSKLLFCEPFQGVFVSRPDGSDARRIMAKGDFPAWADDDTVVAVVSHDDGYVILDATLVAVDINSGDVTTLTGADTKVSESCAAAGRVVYTTLTGDMFMFNLNKAE